MTRQQALKKLLEPITWSWSSSVTSRQCLVELRFNEVSVAYPFLTQQEKKQADKWKRQNKNSELWD